ncbi:MAG: mannose-1-phosphate guanyltransferase [Verrucomicrobia bacterium]|nr:mannose-1-phosphate guanyltransferase [Verrucomicrobiota bacterium]NBS80017.1 mannose-1-phosphate guanyltransferase [bacterium]NBT24655.1 mannose-1-phosphate guanyltransferase [bacterium]NBY65807.1 mannose-1-phosphate guanyltransferase [Verrucomicrobiota bacterium]
MASPFLMFIMAGGSGERFWPLSRKAKPKHLLKLVSSKTLLQETVLRLKPLAPRPSNLLILTNHEQIPGIRKALPRFPKSSLIPEPAKRDTAPAAALATALALRAHPDAVLALLPADALIGKHPIFRSQLAAAARAASASPSFVTLGIQPSYPSTGFGYLHLGSKTLSHIKGGPFLHVRRFVEKPSLPKAKAYLRSGQYAWNAGIFVWKASTFLAEARRQQPALARFIEKFPKRGSYASYLNREFPKLPKISVDYAIMEGARSVLALQASFPWDDVGSWTALPSHLPTDKKGNTLRGNITAVDSQDTLAIAEGGRQIALLGTKNLVVVDTPDALLVCPKDRVQEVKKLMGLLPTEVV